MYAIQNFLPRKLSILKTLFRVILHVEVSKIKKKKRVDVNEVR